MTRHNALFERLLRQRGVDEGFLNPDYGKLADVSLMPDLSRAVDRIMLAAKEKERVVVYGDYDVDGVCSSTVMKEALTMVGVDDVTILLPDRFGEGYGMNMGAVKEIENLEASLVVTVDCGSGSGEVIRALKQMGIDTIVTDHHEIGDVPGEAVAVLNPKRLEMKDDEHGLRNMAGVGVAFTLARALNASKNDGVCDGQEKWLLDLVAIGTVCDAMKLTMDNRTLVYWGLKVLAKTRRVGLRELMRVAGVSADNLSTQAIGFQIGPRLNASGRMKSARPALALLLAESGAEAAALAKELDDFNKERRRAQETAVAEIEQRGVDDGAVLVVDGEWHEGVVGIIAGRLLEQYRRPAIVLTSVGGELMKGSGRSFGEFSLADCLAECQSLLVKGGGHDYACGLTIAKKDLGALKQRVNEFYASLELKNQERFLEVSADLELDDFGDLDEDLCENLTLLEPYGEGNREPVFAAKARVFSARVMKDKHLALTVRDKNGRFLRLAAFYVPKEWHDLAEGMSLKLFFNVVLNDWNGRRSVEGRLLGFKKVLEEAEEL